MADLGLHITLLPIIGQALPRSAATCQNQLLVLQIGLCLFLYVFPVFELLSVLFCSVLLCLESVAEPAACWGKARPHQPLAQPYAREYHKTAIRSSGLVARLATITSMSTRAADTQIQQKRAS